METSRLSIVVDFSARGVQTGVASTVASLLGFERQATQIVGRVGKVMDALGGGARVAKIGGAAAGIVLLGVGFAKALGPAIAFESAFAGVRKTVDGTPAQLESVRQSIIEMSRDMPVAATELANIAEAAGQLGVGVGDIEEFTEVVAQLAATTDLGFEAAARNMARFLNVVEGGVGGIDRASSVLVDLGNNFATTESQILTFATRLGAAFAAAGATSPQILAVATAYSALGVEAEAGGSALSRVITEISDASKLGGEKLRIFAETAGLVPSEFAAIARENPVEAFRLFTQGLGDILATGQSITPTLESLQLNGIRISRVLTLGALSTDQLTAALRRGEQAAEDNSARLIEYGKRAETTASRIQVLKNRFTALAIEVGTPFLDTAVAAIDGLGDALVGAINLMRPAAAELSILFSGLGNVGGEFFNLLGSPALQVGAAAFAGLTSSIASVLGVLAALGPAGVIIGLLAADILLVGPASTAAAAAMGYFGITTAAVAANTSAATIAIKGASTGMLSFAGAASALGLAMRAIPYVAVVAALASIGSEYLAVRKHAEQAGDAMRQAIEDAVEPGTIAATTSGIQLIAERMQELQQIVNSEWKPPFFQSEEYKKSAAELDVLRGIFGDTVPELNKYSGALNVAADFLGISADKAVEYGTKLDNLDLLHKGNASSILQFAEEVSTLTRREVLLADALGITLEQLDAGEYGYDNLGRAVGVSASSYEFLAEKLGVATDLFSENADEVDAASAAVNSLVFAYEILGAQAGRTGDQIIDHLKNVNNLAASYNDLQSAIQGSVDALKLQEQQQRNLEDATASFEEAIASIDSSEASIRNAGEAMATLVSNFAGSGATYGEVIKYQGELRQALIDAGVAAGGQRAEVTALVEKWLQGPDALLPLIQAAGAYNAEIERLRTQSELTAGLYEIYFAVEDEEARLKIIARQADVDYWAEREAIARLNVDDQDALDGILATNAEAQAFAAALFMAILQADGTSAVDETGTVTNTMRDKMLEEFKASLTATGDDAVDTANQTSDFMLGKMAEVYLAELLANGEQARLEVGQTSAEMQETMGLLYLAQLTADGSGARREGDVTSTRLYELAAKQYLSTLTANGGQAISVADQVNRAIRGIPTVWSTSIITYYRSQGSPASATVQAPRSSGGNIRITNADGGIHKGGFQVFDSGGFSGLKMTTPGTANIYAPTYPARVFAEPETGGEAYIPLAPSKRGRSLAIWQETGRLLGAFANGAISTVGTRGVPGGGSIINAPINIDITASAGMDERQLATMVGEEVGKAIRTQGRDLSNRRIRV